MVIILPERLGNINMKIKIDFKTCLKLGITVFVLFLCITYWSPAINLVGAVFSAASPVIIGLAAAYIINILMSFLEKYYFPSSRKNFVIASRRPVCMVLAIILLIGAVSLIVGLVIPELVDCITFLVKEIPPIIEKVIASDFIKEHVPETVLTELYNINWRDYITKMSEVVVNGIGGAVDIIFTTVTSIFSGIVTAFISIIFTIYLLIDKDRLKAQALRMMKCYLPEKVNERALYTLKIFDKCFHRYIVGQVTEAVILGILCTIGMLIFGFPYSGMIGALIGFTALIPIAGAYIGAAVGAVMILTVSPLRALGFLVFIIALQQIEGNLIYPKVVGKSIGLPALWVLAAVTVGGGLFGVTGMLIGVPITAALYRIVRADLRKRCAGEVSDSSSTAETEASAGDTTPVSEENAAPDETK